MAALITKYVDGYVVNVHSREPPSDEEWEVPLRLAKQHGIQSVGTLIWTAGGGPSYKQRQRLIELMKSITAKQPPSAIMHYDSRVVSTIVAVFSLVTNTQLKSFPIEGFNAAFDYLMVPAATRPKLLATITEARKELGV